MEVGVCGVVDLGCGEGVGGGRLRVRLVGEGRIGCVGGRDV